MNDSTSESFNIMNKSTDIITRSLDTIMKINSVLEKSEYVNSDKKIHIDKKYQGGLHGPGQS